MAMLSQMVLGNVCILLHISLESEQKKKLHSNLDIANKSVRPFLFTISNNPLARFLALVTLMVTKVVHGN